MWAEVTLPKALFSTVTLRNHIHYPDHSVTAASHLLGINDRYTSMRKHILLMKRKK